jgi:hypothetical protein
VQGHWQRRDGPLVEVCRVLPVVKVYIFIASALFCAFFSSCDESRGCLGIFREISKASIMLQGCVSACIWMERSRLGAPHDIFHSKRKKTTYYSTTQFATIVRLYFDNHNHRLSGHPDLQYRLLCNLPETIFNNLIVPTPAYHHPKAPNPFAKLTPSTFEL